MHKRGRMASSLPRPEQRDHLDAGAPLTPVRALDRGGANTGLAFARPAAQIADVGWTCGSAAHLRVRRTSGAARACPCGVGALGFDDIHRTGPAELREGRPSACEA